MDKSIEFALILVNGPTKRDGIVDNPKMILKRTSIKKSLMVIVPKLMA